MFLALAGTLIFSLLVTLVETARLGVCENHAARTLRTSAEGLLSEYSRPLYENYSLFFMEQEGTPYETVIAKYAGDTMEASGGKMDFLKCFFQEIKVTEKICAGDDEAEPLEREIISCMGRKLAKNALDKFLEKTKFAGGMEEEADSIEKTVKEQEKLAGLDVLILEMMKLVDGIVVSDGKISCETDFAKSFCVQKKPKGAHYGVRENKVWKKMKGKLDKSPVNWKNLDVKPFLGKLEKVRKKTESAIKAGKELKNKYNGIKKDISGGGENGNHDSYVRGLVGNLSVLNGNLRVFDETKELLESAGADDETDAAETRRQLKALWKDYNTNSLSFDYTGIGDSGGDNPLDNLSDAWKKGIVNLVCRNPGKVSDQSVTNPDECAEYYGGDLALETDYGEQVENFAEKNELELSGAFSGTTSCAWNKFCVSSFLADFFGRFMEEKSGTSWKRKLEYQWEYAIAGEKSDKENLKTVLERILLLRTVPNFTAICCDAKKMKKAYAAAAAVVGFTGLEPLIRLVQLLILAEWSMVEGMVDIAGLLQDKNVPAVKTPKQILTKFAQIFVINRKAITERAGKLSPAGKTSFGYEDYLKLFMAACDKTKLKYRLMDLMQWDMRENGHETFTFPQMVFGVKVRGTVSVPSKLFPSAAQLLMRKFRQMQSVCEVEASYL